jgi:uncharacterized SAM-binding protein YcdF (DUF218 family)
VLLAAVTLAARAELLLYRSVRRAAHGEEARPAGAIVVLGAAEYNGTPSPIFEARLDHAFDLEEKGLAPLVITTGGSGGDARFTEAGVGRDYLIQKGMASDDILAEPSGSTTYESIKAVALLLAHRQIRTCIAVSDGFHIYRVKVLLAAHGITAYGSPAPASRIESDPALRVLYSMREVLILTLYHLDIRV